MDIYLVKLEYPLMYHLVNGVFDVLGNDLFILLVMTLMYASQNVFNWSSANFPFIMSLNSFSKIPFIRLLLLILVMDSLFIFSV